MIIYHKNKNNSKTYANAIDKTKNGKKKYKSIVKGKKRVIRKKPLKKVRQKKKSTKSKKKISSKNVKFLEGLGLKVNPPQ